MRPDDITLTGGLERARAGDAQRVGAITADAFRYDPFNLWKFGAVAGIANLCPNHQPGPGRRSENSTEHAYTKRRHGVFCSSPLTFAQNSYVQSQSFSVFCNFQAVRQALLNLCCVQEEVVSTPETKGEIQRQDVGAMSTQ